tara:strand:- start:336 stop:2264 length:1929 start_codon:yes stop_codon:yes gene_type:complete
MAGAIIEVKYFNTFVLKKSNRTNKQIWNGSFGIPGGSTGIGGYPVVTSGVGGDDSWAIEESRIRGGYNNTSVDFGAKAYIVEEEPLGTRRFNSIIYSGIFNSRTGINQTNVFSVGEDITKSADPANGSIQKLYAEDTNLTVFQELKVSRALIDKDAIYSAEGGGSVTSSSLVIGVIQPYSGKYGISTNPESFAVYGFNKYFSDANNNAILRLSKSGIDEISSIGMKDFFRDNLRLVNNAWSEGKVLGGWDIHNNEYVVSLQDDGTNYYETLHFDERVSGWVSRFSYEPDQMFSLRNEFYTVKTLGETAFGVTTGCASGCGPQTVFQLTPSTVNGNIVPGATIRGCTAVPCVPPQPLLLGVVSSFDSNTSILTTVSPITLTNDVKLFFGEGISLYRHYSSQVNRANFYGIDNRSSITFIFNPEVTRSKTFKTVAYEGSNGWKVSSFTSDNTGVSKAVNGSWTTTFDSNAQIPSYGEGEYVVVTAQANAAAASITTSVNLINRVGTIISGSLVSGDGIPVGTTVVSFNVTSGALVLSQSINVLINSVLFFSSYVSQANYLAVFGTLNPSFDRFYSGFYRKENKYVANLINNSSPATSEVHFGEEMTGIKGFYSVVKFITDTTTDFGNEKSLFSVESEYTSNNGY